MRRPLISTAFTSLVVLLAVGVGAPTARADDVVYEADLEKSRFQIDVFKAGLFSGMAHDHTFLAKRYAATIRLDAAAPEGGSVSVSVEAASLELEASKADADDQEDIEESMRSDDVLDVERFPKIEFESVKVTVKKRKGDTVTLTVTGSLTLHGEKKRISIPTELTIAEGVATAKGEVTIKQTDFEIEPYSAFFGAVKVKDEVKISFEIVARPKAD